MIVPPWDFRRLEVPVKLMAALGFRATRWRVMTTVMLGLSWCALAAAAGPPSPQAPQSASSEPKAQAVSGEPKQQVSITAPEPRYVAPTLRDQIGRIWAPVYIDGKGPFHLVLDTGASHSAVTASVAQALGLSLDGLNRVELHGVTGSVLVPAIHVDSLLVGDLLMKSVELPIVPDALGGADGVLGTEGLLDKRIDIDFRDDRISIKRSHSRWAPAGYVTVPLDISGNRLLTTHAYVGSIQVTAVIDTGAESSVANLALREALQQRRSHYHFSRDQLVDATDAVADGDGTGIPPIYLGHVQIWGAHITLGGIHIFDVWNMTSKPAILIGMDALGRVDDLIIDYRRRELQILVHRSGITTTFVDR